MTTDAPICSGTGPLAAAAARLTHDLRAAAGNPAGAPLLRVEAPLEEPVSPLHWFARQGPMTKVYWTDRELDSEYAGSGVADRIAVDDGGVQALFSRMAPYLAEATGRIRYFGGLRFDREHAGASHWDAFGRGLFVLPRIELCREGNRLYLACNVVLDGPNPADELHSACNALSGLGAILEPAGVPPCEIPPLVQRDDRPDRDAWVRTVETALELIAEGSLEKIVLARESLFQFAEDLDPSALLARLSEAAMHSYRFAFEPDQGVTFLGATPERLYKRTGRHIETEALAGTRPRGPASTDVALSDELLHDDKERREHGIVVDGIRNALSGLCNRLDVDADVSVVRLSKCQHLFERVSGELNDGVSDADVLQALHPTPAVGGHPTGEALSRIASLEPFDRGWYAGPIGWMGRDAAEFAVGLRSGLATGDCLRAFAGAGIVAGSVPQRELDELENKLSILLDAVTVSEPEQ